MRLLFTLILLGTAQAALADNCRTTQNPNNYDRTTVCQYRGQTLQQAYQSHRQKNPDSDTGRHLPAQLPTRSGYYEHPQRADGLVGIRTTWRTPKDVVLELQYEGGVTSVRLQQQAGQIRVSETISPD